MSTPGATLPEIQAAILALQNQPTGVHFADPRFFEAHTNAAGNISAYNGTPTAVVSNTTAFFTGMAQFGIQDNTDWTAGTYKTIYSHTGAGVVYAMIGCTAGGAETTTFEITRDGTLRELTVTNANGERAMLASSISSGGEADYTTAGAYIKPRVILDSATLTTFQGSASMTLLPLRWFTETGQGGLIYKTSMLIRMKHSTSITNSTATAYSAVMCRKFIAS